MGKTTPVVIAVLVITLLFIGVSALDAQTVLPDPGSLKQLGAMAPGTTLLVKVTGKTSGGCVWGTDYYTTDSNLAMAAVHAGALTKGETGVVKVTFYPGRSSYAAASRYGVTTSSWGRYELSFTVEPHERAAPTADTGVLPDPGAPNNLPDASPGVVKLLRVTGIASGGALWGTDYYTADSNLAMAAVHAGALSKGETGDVKVTFYPGRSRYNGSVRNGVKSSNWGQFDLSFVVERADSSAGIQAVTQAATRTTGASQGDRRPTNPSPVAAGQSKITGKFDVDNAMKLIYGNYDPRSKTSRCYDRGMLKEFGGEFSSWNNIRYLEVSVAMEAPYTENQVRKHVFVTAAVPPGNDFDCRSCAPLIGVFVYAEQNGAWVLEHGERHVMKAGSVGEAPDCKLTQIGPKRFGLMCEYGWGGVGANGAVALMVVPYEGRMVEAAHIATWETNVGFASDEKDSYESKVEIKFVPGGNPDFYDIQTISTETEPDEKAGKAVPAKDIKRYTFQGGKYVEVK